MHKRARARRQLLTSPGGHPPVEMAEPASFLSPVSSCARKLDIALQRWGDSPGVPQAPETYRAGLGAGFGAAHAGPSRPAAETNTPAIGPGPFVAHPTPFSATPSAGPFARPDIDTRPIRSEQGLSFAEMLAVNANPDAGIEDDWSAFGKRKAAAMLGEHPAHASFSSCASLRTRTPKALSSFSSRDATNAFVSRTLVAAEDARAFRRDPSAFAREEKRMRTHEKENEPEPEPEHARHGDEETCDGRLPFFLDPDRGVPCVAPETLVAAMRADDDGAKKKNGGFSSAFFSAPAPRTHVMDVRFPHEFRGGHIRGSVNVWDPLELHRALLRRLASEEPRSVDRARADRSPRIKNRVIAEKNVSKKPSRDAYVFVCDGDRFDDRAARAFRHIRGLDRNDHIPDYPALTIPNVYVLYGGFEAFVSHFPQRCTGPRVRRDEAMFAEERRAVARALKDAWRVAGSARGLSRAPDARPFGNGRVSVSFEIEQRESEEWWGEDDGAMRE